jgi:hypothetical protein
MFFGLQKVTDEIGLEFGFERARGPFAFGALPELSLKTGFETGKIRAADGVTRGDGDLCALLDKDAVIDGELLFRLPDGVEGEDAGG